MRKFVIGDIHGSYDQLVELLYKLNLNLNLDKIIFLGDYIDRGPHSYKVIKLLIELQEKFGKDHVVLLRGNHEQMAINNIRRGYYSHFNGFDTTAKDFNKNYDSIENYLGFFSDLPLYYEDEDFVYVHGGIRPGVTMENQVEDDLLWIREKFYNSTVPFAKPVIFGHTPTTYLNGTWTPYITKDKIGIDTGCVYGGQLTALEISERKIVESHQIDNLAA